jgi:hypothetical protein
MSKNRTLTHQEIEQIKAEYMAAYRAVNGNVVADHLEIAYRKGWFYFYPKNNRGLSIPYRASQVKQKTLNLGKLIPQRADSEEDSFQ